MLIGICELYNKTVHGGNNDYMKYNYMMSFEVELDEFFSGEYIDYINLMKDIYSNDDRFYSNDDYSDYSKIVSNPKYYTVNILDDWETDDDEICCVIKTHYIALIQRKWRKIYNERKRIISLRKNPREIIYRGIYGKWSKYTDKYI